MEILKDSFGANRLGYSLLPSSASAVPDKLGYMEPTTALVTENIDYYMTPYCFIEGILYPRFLIMAIVYYQTSKPRLYSL